ncbi:UvrD-helicase domain-containing protein [Gloeomargarita sp.]
MAHLICPPRTELDSLRTPLTAGELRVLEFFDRYLPEGWEIYVQPHLNGLRPDFVLLHPHIGIAVFEVKDWHLEAMPYFVRETNGVPSLWSRDQEGQEFRRRDNPVEKVAQYQQEILDLYCPKLGLLVKDHPHAMSVVTAGVIMTETSTARATELFQPFLARLGWLDDKAKQYHPVVGRDALASGNLTQVFPSARFRRSRFMTPALADDLRSWLREPDHAAEQRTPLSLTPKQKEIATTRTQTGYRRVKGAAGAGKSVSLAARAAHLAGEGKEVLVVTFNITLWHYLRDLAVRYDHPSQPVPNFMQNITWLHFHEWCRRVCHEAGLEEDYGRLFAKSGAQDDLFEERIPALVERALKEARAYISSYDAILVDEGQDFNLTWWNLLRQVRREGGEMLLVADATQDLYQRACRWTDEQMHGAGFSGPWFQLEESYRLPPGLIPYLRRFAETFLSGNDLDLPKEVQGDLFEQPLMLRWLQVQKQDAAVDACVQAVCDLVSNSADLTWADITLLVATHEMGMRCVDKLAKKNIHVCHVFAEDYQSQKRLKMQFWMGDSRLKAATVHSFKGWETRALVVHINKATTASDLAETYVALSRLRSSEKGSFLTVVCSAPELETYGRTWPEFVMAEPSPIHS